jgi:hypothetical protein
VVGISEISRYGNFIASPIASIYYSNQTVANDGCRRHCEERSNPEPAILPDCFTSFAMTGRFNPVRDLMLVENTVSRCIRRPVRDGILFIHFVPNGTTPAGCDTFSTNIVSLTGHAPVIARRYYSNQTAENDGAGACPVRDRMLVENVSHPVCVVPLGTKCMNNIPSLTGRRMHRDSVFSTSIKSLTGLNRPVIARDNYSNQTAENDGMRTCPVRDTMLVENVSHQVCVVPLGTKCMNNIPSLTGRRMYRDTIFSTNIKSLTGLNRHVIGRIYVSTQKRVEPKF